MGDQPPFYPYKETRLSVNPTHPAAANTIRLPSHTLGNHNSRASSRRAQGNDTNVTDDETLFAKRHLATSASVYHRHSKKHPRSFLWRVLEDGKVLSIRCVDVRRSSNTAPDPSLTLRLLFPNPIRPAGVALADSDHHNSVDVFVVTTSNDLYTLSLKANFFHTPSSAEASVEKWCKIFLPSSFSFRYPHRIVARNPQELLVSLHDGGLLRLTRNAEDDGSSWTETFFNEGGWGSSLRGLIPWQGNNTVRYGNTNLEQSTATDLAFSPASDDDSSAHLFTICLDHTLKVWNLSTGKIGSNKDLLDKVRQPHETAKYTIDPSQSSLMTVINQRLRGERDQYYMVTFSPTGNGQFKFWAISNADHSNGVQDLFPDRTFVPPPPSEEIWTMAQFQIASAGDPGLFVLWLLWKNNTNYKVQSLRFDLLRVGEDWQNSWASTATSTIAEQPLPVTSHLDPLDASDGWTEYLFYPGRFSDATLSTALAIYEQNLNVPRNPSNSNRSLQERICTSVGSCVALNGESDGMDYDRYRTDADFQWRRFYRIVAELDKRSGEALSLAFDQFSDIPWVVTADGVAAIRNCNATELVWHNKMTLSRTREPLESSRPDLLRHEQSNDDLVKMAGLVRAASAFTNGFSDHLLHTCHVVLQSEVFQEPSFSAPIRIQSFYDRCNFLAHISEDDVSQLQEALDEMGGVKALTTDMYRALLSRISPLKAPTTSGATMTVFGENVVEKVAQEVIHVNSTMLFDLLMLLVFVETDESFNPEESGPDEISIVGVESQVERRPNLDASEVYLSLLGFVKGYYVLAWLVKTTRTEKKVAAVDDVVDERRIIPQASMPAHGKLALLQSPCFRNWGPRWLQARHSMSALLTESVDDLIGYAELELPEANQRRPLQILLQLISQDEIHLATASLRFQGNDAWSRYVKGRFYLTAANYGLAAVHFKKAAFQLSHRDGLMVNEIANGDDLLIREDEAKYFGYGMNAYYYHIMQLFDLQNVPSFVAEFAEVCSQFVSPVANDDSAKKLRADLLNHLFAASVESSRYDQAYSALIRYADKTRQRNSLTKLITAMCQKGDGTQLLSFPFLGMQNDVDDILQNSSQSTLNIQSGPPYHKILYAWRMKRGDFRGAAAVLHNRLRRLQTASVSSREPENTGVTEGYLALINVLASVDPSQAWVLSSKRVAGEGVAKRPKPTSASSVRTVITMDEIRKEYQQELDRIACIENNQFAFAGSDEMDVL